MHGILVDKMLPRGTGHIIHHSRGGWQVRMVIVMLTAPAAESVARIPRRCHDLHVLLGYTHADEHGATVSMHAHAWDLCEAALCAAGSAYQLIAQHASS